MDCIVFKGVFNISSASPWLTSPPITLCFPGASLHVILFPSHWLLPHKTIVEKKSCTIPTGISNWRTDKVPLLHTMYIKIRLCDLMFDLYCWIPQSLCGRQELTETPMFPMLLFARNVDLTLYQTIPSFNDSVEEAF